MTTDIFRGASESELRDERARRAVKAFRALQPGLTGYARAITGRKDVQVELASGTPRTDGKKIYFRPPIALGDLTPHVRGLCDTRNRVTRVQLCPACKIREEVFITLYHEIAHIGFGTFDNVSDVNKNEVLKRAIEENGSKYAAQIEARINAAPAYLKSTYLGLAGLISPFLPIIVNALEDARVDEAMFKARRGTKVMFDAFVQQVFANGVEQSNGRVVKWSEYALNDQAMIGVFVLACKYNYEGWFHPDVEAALGDQRLRELVSHLETTRSVHGVYQLGFPVLARLRELGFCKLPEDPDDEPEDEESEDAPEPADESEGDEGDPAEEAGGNDSDDAGEVAGGDQSTENAGKDGDPEGRASTGGGDTSSKPSSEEGEAGSSSDESGNSDHESNDSDRLDSSEGADSSGDGAEQDEDQRASLGAGSDELAEGGSEPDDEGSGEAGSGELTDEDREDSDATNADVTDADESGGTVGDGDIDAKDGGGLPEGGGETPEKVEPSKAPGNDSGSSSGSTSGDPCMESGELEREVGSESGDQPGSESPTPDDTDSDDVIDSGADDGEGGVEAPRPPLGSPEEASDHYKVFGKHDVEVSHGEEDSPEDIKAVETAIVQSLYFETPSVNVTRVRVHRYGQPIMEEGVSVSSGWRGNDPDWFGRNLTSLGIDCDTDVPESTLGPALLETRTVFADNQRAKFERHIPAGKINARVLGKRAWSGDQRLFQKKRLPGKRSYAVLIGVDISGSTVGVNIALAKRAAMAQAELCARLGIQFAVYAHTARGSNDWTDNTINLDIYEIKSFDAPWSPKEREALDKIGSDAENLDGHTLEYYRKMIEKTNATDKIILYYTDGKMPAANHDEELEILQREIAYCKRHTITLLGVGIRTDSPIRHGLDTVQVDSDEDLVKVVRHLKKVLVLHR